MLELGQEWILYTSPFRLQEQSDAPSDAEVPSNSLSLYAKESGGVARLFYKSENGTEYGPLDGPAAAALDGSGTANRLAYWSDANTLAAVGALTAGRVVFPDSNGLPTGSSKLFWVDADSRLAIGTSGTFHDPSGRTHLAVESDNASGIELTSHNDSEESRFVFLRSRGTHASPTSVASGDRTLILVSRGYDGSAYRDSSGIFFEIDGTPGASDMPGRIVFYTAADGSASLTERLRITSAGLVGIGTNSPSFKFHVVEDGNFAQANIESFRGASADTRALLRLTGKRGSVASPSNASADDNVGELLFLTRIDGADRAIAGVLGFVGAAPGASSYPGYLAFYTAPASTAGRTERLRIEETGDISHASGVKHRMLSQNRFRFLNSMAWAWKITTAQTLSNDTVTAITFNTEDFDTDALHDVSVDNTRLTAKIAGKYLCVGGIEYANGGPSTERLVLIRRNGTTTMVQNRFDATTGGDAIISCATLISLGAGDYIEIVGRQKSGGNLNVQATTGTFGAMAYVGE